MSPGAPFDSAFAKAGLVAALVVAVQLRHRPRMGAGEMARGVAVGVFGAVPATILVLPTLAIGFNAADALQDGRDVAFFAGVCALATLAVLGTLGLWLASVRPAQLLTLALVACGLLVDGAVIVHSLLTDPGWLMPRAFDRQDAELLMRLAPFAVGTAYMASVLPSRRAAQPEAAGSRPPRAALVTGETASV